MATMEERFDTGDLEMRQESGTGRVLPALQAPRFRYCGKPCANRGRPWWLCTNVCGHGSRHRGRCLCPPCFNGDPDEASGANNRARAGRTGPIAGVPWHFLESRGTSDEAVTDSTQPCSELHCRAFAVGHCDNCWLWHCGAHLGPCGACGRGPFCPVCATPINHTCIPRRPVPQDPPGANGAPADPPRDAVADPAAPVLQDAVSPGGAAVSHDRLAGKSLAVPSDAVGGVLIPLGPRHDGLLWETPPHVVEAVRLVPSPSLSEMLSDIPGRNGPEAQSHSTGPREADSPAE